MTATCFQFNILKIAPILHHYISKILEYGIIPDSWKINYLIPIPIKGSSSDVRNYRGIAWQSIIPSFFDKLLTRKLAHHLHPITPSTQHGFMKNRNTISNLFEISQFTSVSDDITKGNQVDAIHCYLS